MLLTASDGLEGKRNAVKRQFPEAGHQQRWAHLSCTVARNIRQKDRKEVLNDLKPVCGEESEAEARTALDSFL